jgi:tetratricopeptide (TPR) repeat protein
MLGASAYFAFKIYEHIQTLQEPEKEENESSDTLHVEENRTADSFSVFSPESLVLRADEAFEADDNEKALALLFEANVKKPNDSEILFKIAYILQQTGNDDESLKHYKLALEVDKSNEYIHNAMASIYRKNGEYTSAKIHIKASLDIDDENPITYYNYGNLLVDMKSNEEAIVMYERAIELNPEFSEAKDELSKLQ